jgi:hypothetical protein
VGQSSGERLIRARTTRVSVGIFAVALFAGGCTSAAAKPTGGSSSGAARTSAPLVAPTVTSGESFAFFQDLSRVDPSLSSYVNSNQSVALRSLITDGAAFCAFLRRGGDVDDAMASVVVGAKSVESETHLPISVKTFNAVDAVALVDLCPKEQTLLPAADRSHIRSLTQSLSSAKGASGT